MFRISKNGAKIFIEVPYFRSFCSVIDPTHKFFFGVHWFFYFDPSHRFYKKYNYTKAKFNIDKIEFDRAWKGKIKYPLHYLMVKIANFKSVFYEERLSHLCLLDSLTFF